MAENHATQTTIATSRFDRLAALRSIAAKAKAAAAGAATTPTRPRSESSAEPGVTPLRTAQSADEALAAHEAFEERAAIMEFDGGLSREDAEVQARLLVGRPRG